MMKISTSTYYYKPKKSRALRDFEDAQLRDEIDAIQTDFPFAGYRTMREYLFRRTKKWHNYKKIRRIMNKYGLQAHVRRRFISTTDSKHGLPVYPNLISGKTITGINQVWAADITYIRIATGFVYLAVILDLFSRRIIGWALSKSLTHRFVLDALRVAIDKRKPSPGLIHHSDQGVQYASSKYVEELENHQILISMSRKGNPYDNAFVESFMKTLKKEEVHLWQYESFVDVIERVPYFIEQVYNRKRVHSGIGYLPPEEFETILSNDNLRDKLGQLELNIS
jgi:transposase InsO family protein